MTSPRKSLGNEPKGPPPKTPEEMETYLIGLAYDRAAQQLKDGSASPTTINYFLRLGSTRAELELEKAKGENELLSAKTSQIKSAEKVEELFAKAMKMFGTYRGEESGEDDDFYEDLD